MYVGWNFDWWDHMGSKKWQRAGAAADGWGILGAHHIENVWCVKKMLLVCQLKMNRNVAATPVPLSISWAFLYSLLIHFECCDCKMHFPLWVPHICICSLYSISHSVGPSLRLLWWVQEPDVRSDTWSPAAEEAPHTTRYRTDWNNNKYIKKYSYY